MKKLEQKKESKTEMNKTNSNISLRNVLEDMSHAALKNEVKKFQIQGYTSKSKEELINAMLDKGELFSYLITDKKKSKLMAKPAAEKPKKLIQSKLNIPMSVKKPKLSEKPLNLIKFGLAIDKLKSLVAKGKKTDKMPLDEVINYAQTLEDVKNFIDLNKINASAKTKEYYKDILNRFPRVTGSKLTLPSSFYKAFEN